MTFALIPFCLRQENEVKKFLLLSLVMFYDSQSGRRRRLSLHLIFSPRLFVWFFFCTTVSSAATEYYPSPIVVYATRIAFFATDVRSRARDHLFSAHFSLSLFVVVSLIRTLYLLALGVATALT